MQTLKSVEDQSINFVENQLEGFVESRYVRKCDEYFICYLSSQSACSRGCKFCHLTAMKQTRSEDVRPEEYVRQAAHVLSHYNGQPPAKYVHFNFMARGEALCNAHLLHGADEILYALGKRAHAVDSALGVKFNMSTIMPRTLDMELVDVFKIIHPTMYYSLYSANEGFRKHWMPNAMPLAKALRMLHTYQVRTKKVVKIHQCFIEGQNDSYNDLAGIVEALKSAELDVEFNLVRYNPFSPEQGRESSDAVIGRNIEYLDRCLPGRVKVIPRVGYDVHASCGTFYSGSD